MNKNARGQAILLRLKNSFSTRMIFVYSFIAFIPIIIFFVLSVIFIGKNSRKELYESVTDSLSSDVRHISDAYESMQLPYLVIRQNDRLMLFLTIPEERNPDEIIETTLSEVTTMEQILSVTQLYAIRIFFNSSAIPERWPIFLNKNRAEVSLLDEWEYNYRADFMGNAENLKLPSVCMTRKLSRSGRDVGYLQICVKMTDFFPFLYTRNDVDQQTFVFNIHDGSFSQIRDEKIDEVQVPLSKKDGELFEKLYSNGGRNSRKPNSVPLSFGRSLVCWETVPQMDLVVFRVNSLRKNILGIFYAVIVALFVLILSTFIFFTVVKFFTLRMTNGIYSIMNGMKTVQGGNVDVLIPVNGHGEVGEAQHAFNDMTLKLKNQMLQIKQEQELIADTELKAMQNQINAHFLYNVLETIRMQAVIADQEEIAESIMTLGKMMRYCLRWRVHEVTLAQEVEYIQSYIHILNVRNDYTITLNVSIPEELMTHSIPKMLVQPIVENAFVHGIEPLAKDASIHLYTEVDEANGKLWLCVKDTGLGMPEEKLLSLRNYLANRTYERETEGSIGVKNIQQRLFMFYGDSYVVHVETTVNEGTLVKIPVPLALKKGEPDADCNS